MNYQLFIVSNNNDLLYSILFNNEYITVNNDHIYSLDSIDFKSTKSISQNEYKNRYITYTEKAIFRRNKNDIIQYIIDVIILDILYKVYNGIIFNNMFDEIITIFSCNNFIKLSLNYDICLLFDFVITTTDDQMRQKVCNMIYQKQCEYDDKLSKCKQNYNLCMKELLKR